MINRICEAILEYIDERIAVVLVGFIVVVVSGLGFLIYATIADSQSPVLTLKKTEWECSGTRSEPTTIYIQSGKTIGDLDRGVIVGTVKVTGIVSTNEVRKGLPVSDWFVGEFGYVLAEPVLFDNPIPCKGALSLWEVPADVIKQFPGGYY